LLPILQQDLAAGNTCINSPRNLQLPTLEFDASSIPASFCLAYLCIIVVFDGLVEFDCCLYYATVRGGGICLLKHRLCHFAGFFMYFCTASNVCLPVPQHGFVSILFILQSNRICIVKIYPVVIPYFLLMNSIRC